VAEPDKVLFTPGPLTTSRTVKQAMLRDLGSRDLEFVATVRDIRRRLLQLGAASQQDGFEAVLIQGSGTFGVESVISSALPGRGRLLALVNGAYGERIARLARVHGVPVREERRAEDSAFTAAEVAALLAAEPALTHVAIVHCETTTGLMNPVEAVADVVRAAGRRLVVDSMSAFGAVPVDLRRLQADFLVSSSNKCIEGVPGFAFVLARRDALLAAEGNARTLSLDLCAQWRGLEADGQFRFTPPVQAILAFARALDELDQEGGVAARARRYRDNQRVLLDGMRALGFRSYLPAAVQGPIIATFRYPGDPRFQFAEFYARLSAQGFVIYPGKLTQQPCFRIGNIGRIGTAEIEALLAAIGATARAMGFDPAAAP
jgi:2-aminoethylphosphonate-pyruvate transaminase